MTDAELLEAVRSDRPGAFDAFVARYGTRIMAFGMRMCGHRQDAEDVYQDTLLTAFRGLDRLRDSSALRTWLYKVAANRCLMSRRQAPPHRSLSFEEIAPPGLPEEELPELADWSHLPELDAERGELRKSLEGAITSVPPEQRIVLLLRDVEGFSTKETAEVLGLGPSAVKMRLHRARERVRNALLERFRGIDDRRGDPPGQPPM